MPAFREQESKMTILNQLPRAGGCFDRRNGGLATGERAWALLSEQNNGKNDRDTVHGRLENGDDGVLQIGQAVSVNFVHRRMSANVVRKIPCSRKVEVCLQDGIRVVVDQHDMEIMENTEECSNTSQMMKGIAGNQTAPLIIDIPNEIGFESQNADDAEEKMAAAVLTSLSLSPVLKNFQFEQDKIFEDAMNTEGTGDEASSSTTLSDQENNKEKFKLRRRKRSSKTLFQCTWPRCKKLLKNSNAIVRHVRAMHLGPKKDGSDGEEEFYFIEIEQNPNDMADPQSREEPISPPLTRMTSRRCRSFSDPLTPTQAPVSSNAKLHVDDNFIWPLRQAGGKGKVKRPLHQTLHTNTRKARGDGKKCRKVFGMDNKHMWCTQCRWKKACVKFID